MALIRVQTRSRVNSRLVGIIKEAQIDFHLLGSNLWLVSSRDVTGFCRSVPPDPMMIRLANVR